MPPKRNVRPDFVEENYKNGSIHKFPKIYSSGRRVKRGDAPEQVFSHRKCETLFYEYTSTDDHEVIGPNGIQKFCEDIGIEPENVIMLLLAWKMEARQMGFFRLSE
ncbi:DCN1-like protein 4 isoform X2 [Tachypleus tridentatus]|uniref:DCN1-like protein 4 isoform X2 n=1 Tax=Tachypleus tridentatus TaxID=6853 RepID=UPI003FD28C20